MKPKRIILTCLFLIIGLLGAFYFSPSPARAGGGAWTVNTDDDTDDGTCSDTHCSLREAINHVNALPGNQLIWFDIPGPAPHIIQLCSMLPPITDAVEIDGAQPPGSVGPPTVVIKPFGPLPLTHVIPCSPPPIGFFIASSDVTVRNLSMVGFNSLAYPVSGAIIVNSGANIDIEHNYLGLFPTGTALGNREGVLLGSDGATVHNNVVSGNWNGIHTMAANTIIQGNFIGTDPTGSFTNADLRNEIGILLNFNANSTVIGGTNSPMMNVISGNGIGIDVRSDSNAIIGNHIGTDLSGTANLGNSNGIILTDVNNNIGGTIPGAGNIISGNHLGISIGTAGDGNVIKNNKIGSDITGTLPIPNYTGIVVLGQDNVIGGLNAAEENLVAYNLDEGIEFGHDASANLVAGNTITGNETGILMKYDGVTDIPVSNAITKNSIHANLDLGIDLEPAGVSLNDPGDGDDGANTLRNYPEFSSASSTLAQGEACPGCSVEVFLSDNDPSGYGEGMSFVGGAVADPGGQFSASLSGASACDWITGTATDALGNTSEFSENFRVQPCYILDIPIIILFPIGLIIFGGLGGRLFSRASNLSAAGATAAGAIGGGLIAASLLAFAFVHPNFVIAWLSEPDEVSFQFPLCEQYLDSTGRFPKSGAIFTTSEDPTLSWLPRDPLPEGETRWVVQLRTPADTTLSQALTSTSLSFSSFELQPEQGDIYEWRIWGEKNYIDLGGWRGYCTATLWWSFRFGPLPEIAEPPWQPEFPTLPTTPPVPSPTPIPTSTPTPTPAVCIYTALQNANCRASDYVESAQIAVLLQGESAELIALNPAFTHGKFELQNQQQCWIWLGLMDGPPNPYGTCGVPVVAPPPKPTDTPTPLACRPDLDRKSCELSGGTWNESLTTQPQCVCP
ncbi:MAG: CSLREA domain-containing protein [Anaerolineales bacterium]|nr:CSLREA domain-containing protein [Anaerolineales bacterium]